MKRLHLLVLMGFAAVLSACGPISPSLNIHPGPKANPWTHLKLNNDPQNFQFVIVSDRTGGYRPGVFARAIHKINLLQPEFVICVGDLIGGYTEDEAELNRQWDQFDRLVKKLQMPFFYVPGNHDISNKVMLEKWNERLGTPYYHFTYGDVLFLALDTEGGRQEHNPGYFSEEQIEYFRTVLRKNPTPRWTLVFLHRPVWQDEEQNWSEFEKLLADRDYTVFAGHDHQYARAVRDGRRYIRLATTGGRSTLDGTVVGTFDHVVWVTMTYHGPRVANLLLDGIHDENVTPYVIAAAARFLQDKIDEGKIIQFDPINVEGETFTGGKTTMRITNYAVLPMKVEGSFKKNPHLKPIPNTVDASIAPLWTKTIEIEVGVDRPVKVESLSPLVHEAAISYKFPGKPRVHRKISSKIRIVRPTNQ